MNPKPNGYRPIKSWRIGRCSNVVRQGGELQLYGRPVLDFAPSSKIVLENQLLIGANLRRGSNAETYLKLREDAVLQVKQRFQLFFGSSVELFAGGRLTLGRGYLNSGAVVTCARSITLGDGVFVARNAHITDSDHHQILSPDGIVLNEPEPVVIEDHVLICFGAMILKGVTIGTGSMIAAGAVVTQDIPPHSLAAGAPARVIREGIVWK